jgi:hypothetical protein
MTMPKNDKYEDYARYAKCCLNVVTATVDQEPRRVQRENGRRMAETGGCNSAPSQIQTNANGMMYAASVGGRSSVTRARASDGVQGDQIHGPHSDRAQRMDRVHSSRRHRRREKTRHRPPCASGAASSIYDRQVA